MSAPAMLLAVCSVLSVISTSQSDAKCGLNCLYASLVALEADGGASLASIERDLGPIGPSGYSLGQLADVAKERGLHTLVVETTLENLTARRERFCCIAHVSKQHFLIIGDYTGSSVKIIDPPTSDRWDRDALESTWDGIALLVSLQPLESESDVAERVSLYKFVRRAGWVCGSIVAFALLVWGGLKLRHRLVRGSSQR